MTTTRSRTYRQEMLEREPAVIRDGVVGRVCRACEKWFPDADIQADHVQELADNGGDDWLVPLCRPCHVRKTRDRRERRRGARAPHRFPSTRKVVGWVLVVGSVGWMVAVVTGREETARAVLLTAGVVGALLAAVGAPLAHRGRRRAARVEDIRQPLAKVMQTLPELLRLRVREWDGLTPVRGQVSYGRAFDDSPGSKARSEAGLLLGRKIGRPTQVRWYPDENVAVWEPAVARAPAVTSLDADRHSVINRLSRGIAAEIGSVGITVEEWVGAQPRSFLVTYPAEARVHNDRVQDAVEDKVGTLLTGSWRAVWDTHSDVVRFTDTPDPLTQVVTPDGEPVDMDLSALVLGRCDNGEPWRFRLRGSEGVSHTLIVGTSGSGKGSVIWSLLWSLLPGLLAGTIRLWGADPKGGMELGKGRQVWDRYATSVDRIVEMLVEAVRVMDERAERLAAANVRNHVPTVAEPLIVVVIDELGTLTKYVGDRKTTEKVRNLLGLLLTKARAVGLVVVAAGQDPRKEVIGDRDQFANRIALRLTDPRQPDLALADNARAAGARADRIPKSLPGVAYVVRDGEPEADRVRAYWMDDERIERLSTLVAAIRPAALPAAPEWEPVYARDLSPVGDEWIRVDFDGRQVEGLTVALGELADDEDAVEVEWAAEPRYFTLGDDEVVQRRT